MARLLFEDYLQLVKKDLLLDVYITQNKTVKECCEIFGVSQSMLMRILKHYQIRKPVEAHVQNIKQSKLEHFGDSNYNNPQKRTQTNLEKYGVENQFQRSDLFPQIYQLKVDKYGTYNNIQKNFETRAKNYGSVEASYQAQKETYRQTCLEKYNVENAAKLPQVKQQIANSLKETFLERYGVENYWARPDAIRSAGSKDSTANLAFKELLEANQLSYIAEFPLGGKWFDFKVDNYLIEINPTPTHNSTWGIYSTEGLDRQYHKQKTDIATNAGYRCIHVFDWDDPAKIINMLLPKSRLYARDCQVQEVSAVEAATYLVNNHFQGYAKDRIRLGLFYDGELVSLMTFGAPRYNKNYQYELIRYCTTANIVGGAEKLFKHFIDTYSPNSIISYCDLSKFDGKVYEKLGFHCIRKAKPSKHWYNLKSKQHITDNLLRQRGYDQLFKTNYGRGTSNDVLMLESNFVEVYDCGQATFSWIARTPSDA